MGSSSLSRELAFRNSSSFMLMFTLTVISRIYLCGKLTLQLHSHLNSTADVIKETHKVCLMLPYEKQAELLQEELQYIRPRLGTEKSAKLSFLCFFRNRESSWIFSV